jgi:hypothetical protein
LGEVGLSGTGFCDGADEKQQHAICSSAEEL